MNIQEIQTNISTLAEQWKNNTNTWPAILIMPMDTYQALTQHLHAPETVAYLQKFGINVQPEDTFAWYSTLYGQLKVIIDPEIDDMYITQFQIGMQESQKQRKELRLVQNR